MPGQPTSECLFGLYTLTFTVWGRLLPSSDSVRLNLSPTSEMDRKIRLRRYR
jgi:hypothetical protein